MCPRQLTNRTQETTIVSAAPIPDIGNTQVSPKDNMTMVFIPAGEFNMGGENEELVKNMVSKTIITTGWIVSLAMTTAVKYESEIVKRPN
jgi:formylglycine-generating enzyme required for sulfatase activity